MPSALKTLRRRAKALHRNLRGANMAVRALASTDHPLLAHIIPMRRCNLACTYCNEFDDFSKPVPIDEMYRRIDKLGSLGTAVVTISGGEPLMHPELDDVICRIRANGMIAGLITNGYLLVAERIQRLNRAGLEWLQISIDNVNPDEVSKKSLKVLDKKLQLLAEHADFHVNINSVVGGGIAHPQDALVIGILALMVALAVFTTEDLPIYLLFVPFIAVLSRDGRVAQALFGNRLVYHLGVISYSIYLFHPLFFTFAERSSRHLGNNLTAYVLCTVAAFAAIWLLSYLSYRFVEMPGRQFVIGLLSPRAKAAPAGT